MHVFADGVDGCERMGRGKHAGRVDTLNLFSIRKDLAQLARVQDTLLIAQREVRKRGDAIDRARVQFLIIIGF